MLIVDRETFLAMPAGTVFAKYKPCVFDELSIKEDTCGTDFAVQDIIPQFVTNNDSGDYFDTLDAAERGEPTPRLDYDICGRDGMFDKDQLFAVFERHDVKDLIARLTKALDDSFGDKPYS
jgi:hypothetical protein